MTFRQNGDPDAFHDFLDMEMAQRRSERFWKRYREKHFLPKEKEKKRKWFRRRRKGEKKDD